MKKVLFALAIAGMFGFAACKTNNNEQPAEEPTTVENVTTDECTTEADTTATVECAADAENAETNTEVNA